MTDRSYFQDIVSALEKALYYERGRGGYFRATMVGTDFIDREQIKGETSEEVIESCVNVLVENKMIKNVPIQTPPAPDASERSAFVEMSLCSIVICPSALVNRSSKRMPELKSLNDSEKLPSAFSDLV